MRHSKKRLLNFILVVALCMSEVILCGGLFDPSSVALDTKKNIIYQSANADDIIGAFKNDKDTAKKDYDNNYYMIFGSVSSKKDNNKELTVGKAEGKVKSITCKTSDKALIKIIETIGTDDAVYVYGKLSVGMSGNSLSIKIDGIGKTDKKSTSDSVYSLLDGNTINRDTMKKRKIDGTDITFLIPSSWERVEHDLKKEGLGTKPGYQYRLNEISKQAMAESLFICYFDKNSLLVDENDFNENNAIEEAIIRDILDKGDKSLDKYPCRTDKTYYRKTYKYYKDKYVKHPSEDSYRAEFVFNETEEGILLYLYIYSADNMDKHNTDDIMFVLKFLGESK